MRKYIVKEEEGNYIELRIKQTKLEIIKAILFSVLIPFLFMTLKTSFFKKDINALLIFICVGMFILALVTMVSITIKKLHTFKNLVKEIDINQDGTISILTAGGMKTNDKIINFNLFVGYKGTEKMKNIFDVDSTYRFENFEKSLRFYFISNYFENWDELKSILSEKTHKIA